MANHTKCTPETIAKIGEMVSKGSSLRNAAGACGIGKRTLLLWREKAKKGIVPYKDIMRPLKRALAEARGMAEQRVYSGKGTWQSSARWLESLSPALWRRTERQIVEQTSDVRVRWPDLAARTPDALARRSAAVDEALRKPGKN